VSDTRKELDNNELQQLVEESKAGDRKAIGALCRHMHPRIYKYLYYRINNADDVEDQTSEVCLKVLRSIG